MSMAGWVFRNVAILAAWAITVGIAKGIGFVLGWDQLYLAALGWIAFGGLVLTHKGVDYPMPRSDGVDVAGALKMFWWMAWWPRFLRRR